VSTAATVDELGPVDHLIIEFPDGRITVDAFSGLIDLVDRRMICVLDLEFVTRAGDGTVAVVDVADLPQSDELSVIAGSSSGLLDEDDLASIGDALQRGALAAVLVFENLWIAPMLTAFRDSGGHIVSENRVPVEDLLVALERIDALPDSTSV
jgi:hypothetical protein